MSAKQPVDLAAYRATRPAQKRQAKRAARRPGAAPIALTAHAGAVHMVVPQADNWLSPRKARELGEDLIRLSKHSDGSKSRG